MNIKYHWFLVWLDFPFSEILLGQLRWNRGDADGAAALRVEDRKPNIPLAPPGYYVSYLSFVDWSKCAVTCYCSRQSDMDSALTSTSAYTTLTTDHLRKVAPRVKSSFPLHSTRLMMTFWFAGCGTVLILGVRSYSGWNLFCGEEHSRCL